ncbi:MAG: CHAT domain-containing protein [Candidatus Helarchaeota archaeon]
MIGRTKGILILGIIFLVFCVFDFIIGILCVIPFPGTTLGGELLLALTTLPYIGGVYSSIIPALLPFIYFLAGLMIFSGIIAGIAGIGILKLKLWGFHAADFIIMILFIMGIGIIATIILFFIYWIISADGLDWIVAILIHPFTLLFLFSIISDRYLSQFHIQIALGNYNVRTPLNLNLNKAAAHLANWKLNPWKKDKKAVELYRQASQKYRASGDTLEFIDLLRAICDHCIKVNEYKEGLKYLNEALQLTKTIQDEVTRKNAVLIIQTELGGIYKLMGQGTDALKFYYAALDLAEELDYAADKSFLQNNIGLIQESWGNFSEAFNLYSRALELAKKQENQHIIAEVLGNLASIYLKWGKPDETLAILRQKLAIYETLHLKEQIKRIRAIITRMEQKFDETLSIWNLLYRDALEKNDNFNLAKIIFDFGQTYWRMGNISLAGIFYLNSYRLFEEFGMSYNMAISLHHMNAVALKTGDIELVLKNSKKSIKIFEKFGDLAYLGYSFINLGYVYKAKRKFNEAFNHFVKAIDILENLIGHTESEEIRKAFRASQLRPYQAITALLLEWYSFDHDPTHLIDGLKFLELSKAREILDTLEKGKMHVQSCPELQDLVQKEQELIEELMKVEEEIESQRNRGNLTRGLPSEYSKKNADLKKIRATLMEKCKDPGLVRTPSTYNPIPDFKGIFEKTNIIVWEFIYFPEIEAYKNHFKILAWDGKTINIYQSNPMNKNLLLQLLQNFYEALKNNQFSTAQESLRQLQIQLGRLFRQDILSTLENKQKLILIPHNIFHLFPWEIVEPIGLQIPLVRSYSLGLVRALMKREQKTTNFLFVSNPNFNIPEMKLKGADLEVASIIELLNQKGFQYKLLSKKDATEPKFSNLITQEYGIIHFAGHGIYAMVENDPWTSGLLFYKSSGGELPYDIRTVTELVTQRFKGTPLFILSACETGRSKFSKGDELIGLIRGLTLAGATSIIATNWALSDAVAPIFMKNFYEHFLTNKDVCESLFFARKSIFKFENSHNQQVFANPIFWGVYTLYGNPFKKLD